MWCSVPIDMQLICFTKLCDVVFGCVLAAAFYVYRWQLYSPNTYTPTITGLCFKYFGGHGSKSCRVDPRHNKNDCTNCNLPMRLGDVVFHPNRYTMDCVGKDVLKFFSLAASQSTCSSFAHAYMLSSGKIMAVTTSWYMRVGDEAEFI